jgi:hypothetical protein
MHQSVRSTPVTLLWMLSISSARVLIWIMRDENHCETTSLLNTATGDIGADIVSAASGQPRTFISNRNPIW